MEQTAGTTVGTRWGAAIGAGIGAIVDGIAKIGYDLQLDLLAEATSDGVEAVGDHVKEGWSRWHAAQPITSTSAATAAATTAALVAFAGKRGLMVALTGSALAGALLLPLILTELLDAEPMRRRRDSQA